MADPESIGVATLEPDGTLVLLLRATGPGVVGDARFVYRTDHPQYAVVLAHVQPIQPGQTVQVKPFPEG